MSYLEEIESLRKRNDCLNAEIVEKISELVRTSKKIGILKGDATPRGVSAVFDESTMESVRGLAEEYRLDVEGVERIFQALMALCVEAVGGVE